MPTIVKVNRKDGTNNKGKNQREVTALILDQMAKAKCETVTALTDNSTGNASPAAAKVQYVAPFTSAANSGTSLAQKAATETALGKIKDAVAELAAQANTFATLLGATGLTDNSGGTTPDKTIAACDKSVTAATTGAQITETNAIAVSINDAFAEIVKVLNRVASSLNLSKLTLETGMPTANGTIPAIATVVGTAADPGITKVAMDAALVKWVDNIAYIAAKLNTFRAVANVQIVVR